MIAEIPNARMSTSKGLEKKKRERERGERGKGPIERKRTMEKGRAASKNFFATRKKREEVPL